jgi:hypothetical protein
LHIGQSFISLVALAGSFPHLIQISNEIKAIQKVDKDSQQKSVAHPQLKTLSFNNTALMSLGMDGN